jgi:hypothetical protein
MTRPQQTGNRIPSQPGRRLVVFLPSSNAALAEFYPPPTVAIWVNGPLTADMMISELRSRPAAAGMDILEVHRDLPIGPLLSEMPRLVRAICPLLSERGTAIQLNFGVGRASPGGLQFLAARVCPRVRFVQ